jgi:putative flippase GtrA
MLALFVSIIIALEIARRVPLLARFRNLARVSARTPRVWSYRRGLEVRKERATQLLSLHMFRHSISLLWMLALVIAPIILVLLVDTWLDFGAQESLKNWRDRLVVAVLSLAYGLARIQIARRLQRP